jgi:spore germination protein AB
MEKIQRQFRSIDVFAFTFCSTITLGFAFFPFISGGEMRNAWLKIGLSSLPYFFLIWLIYKFVQHYPDSDFFGALKQHIWKILYWPIMMFFIVSTLISLSRGINEMNLLMNIYLLHNTPKWAILLSFLCVVGMAVYYGIQSITRFVVLFIVLEFMVLLLVLLQGFGAGFHWFFLPPLSSIDLLTLLKGSTTDLARYGGVVALLAFIMYVKPLEPFWKPMSLALASVTFLYVGLSIVTVGTFGFEQTVHLISPSIALTQSIKTEAGLAERLDLLFVGFWIISFFKISAIHLWFSVFLVKKCWPNFESSILTALGCIFTFIFTIYFVDNLSAWREYNIIHISYSLIVPSLLLIYLLLKKPKQTRRRTADDTSKV